MPACGWRGRHYTLIDGFLGCNGEARGWRKLYGASPKMARVEAEVFFSEAGFQVIQNAAEDLVCVLDIRVNYQIGMLPGVREAR